MTRDDRGRFMGSMGTKDETPPVAVKLPSDLYQAVCSIGEGKVRANWLRQAIKEALIRDGILPVEVG